MVTCRSVKFRAIVSLSPSHPLSESPSHPLSESSAIRVLVDLSDPFPSLSRPCRRSYPSQSELLLFPYAADTPPLCFLRRRLGNHARPGPWRSRDRFAVRWYTGGLGRDGPSAWDDSDLEPLRALDGLRGRAPPARSGSVAGPWRGMSENDSDALAELDDLLGRL